MVSDLRVLINPCQIKSYLKSIALFPVIYYLFIANSYAQDLDNSIHNLNESKTKSERAINSFNLFIYYSKIDFDSALYYAKQTRELAEDSLLVLRSEYALAFLYRSQSAYDKAILHYKNALTIAKNNFEKPEYNDRMKAIENALGVAYYFNNNYDSALQHHFESIKLRSDPNELAIAYTNTGLVYYQISDYKSAIEYQNKAIEQFELVGKEDMEENYVNLGVSYNALKNYKEALESFRMALKLCAEKNCSDKILFETYNGLGILFKESNELSNLDTAEFYFDQAISLVNEETESDLSNLSIALHNKADISIKKGKIDTALYYVAKSRFFSDSVKNQFLIAQNFRLYAEIFDTLKSYEDAYRFFYKYDSVDKLILNQTVLNNINRIQLTKETDAREEIIREKKNQLTLSIVIISLISSILFILYRNIQQRKKANIKLFEANKTIEDKNEQLRNINNILEEKVRERTLELNLSNEALLKSNMELDNFIYKTSHDIRGPLATLQGICNVALMDVSDSKALDYLDKLENTASKLNQILSKLLIINQINNSIISQTPINFHEITREVVLENQRINIEKHIEAKIKIENDLKFRSDDDLIRIILSNLVSNSFKYYKKSYSVTSFIEILVIKNNIHLVMKVTDNGIGIDQDSHSKVFEIFSKASEMSDSAGLGLYLVKLAVEKLDGNISLSKSLEGYTEFTVKLPFV